LTIFIHVHYSKFTQYTLFEKHPVQTNSFSSFLPAGDKDSKQMEL